MAARATYHHGDLATALIDAGLELTREHGPAGLTIREATRRAGVSPNAAYRHFTDRDALLAAVSLAIQARMAAAMEFRPDVGATAAERARAHLAAVGRGYIAFALAEPGWFSTAFFGAVDPRPSGGLTTPEPDAAGRATGPAPPFVALVAALDAMRDAGALTEAQRADAEWPCFAAVHGFAELALRGPLRAASDDDLAALAHRVVEVAIDGLTTG